jgi:hypothetical protein
MPDEKFKKMIFLKERDKVFTISSKEGRLPVSEAERHANDALIGRVIYGTAARLAFPDLNVDENSDYNDITSALHRARPDWDLTEGSLWNLTEGMLTSGTISSVMDLLLNEIEQHIPENISKGSVSEQIFWQLARRRTKEEKPAPRKKRQQLPEVLPQQTFMEARNLFVAIADGRTLRRWQEVRGEIALRHAVEGEPIQTKLTAGPALEWWGMPVTYDGLRTALHDLGAEGVLLYNICLGLALEEQHATIELDDLIRAVGWRPRSVKERVDMRRKIFWVLCVFDSFTSHGKRPGGYTDPMTGSKYDLTIASKLVMLSELQYATGQQMRFDGSELPVKVTLTAGPWLDRHRDDKRVLQHFINVRKLAGLPTNQPRGGWALSIGLALNQLWRERGAGAKIVPAHGGKDMTVEFERKFTRYELLDLFRPKVWVEDVLNSSDPKRAQKIWNEAIKLLKECGVIGRQHDDYKEVDPAPTQRKGWQDYWLKGQRLDIRPKADGIKIIAELSRKSTAMKNVLARKRGSRTAKSGEK